MFISLLIFITVYTTEIHADVGDRPELSLKILLPQELLNIEAKIRKGHSWIPMRCGDGQQFAFDGEEDNIWTCQYFGPLGETERIAIESSQVSTTLFDGLISIPNKSSTELGFLIKRVDNQWRALRTSIHQNTFVNNLMVTDREWVIALWSVLVVQLIGIMLWFSRKTK